MIICLILPSPADFSDPPENNPGRIMVFYSVLLRVRFTWHPLLPEDRWALTPPFHPYREHPAVYFCCTVFGVASTGRYPAPCPVKPGLSSPPSFQIPGGAIIYPTLLGITCYLAVEGAASSVEEPLPSEPDAAGLLREVISLSLPSSPVISQSP